MDTAGTSSSTPIESGWSFDWRRRASATTDTRSKMSVSDFLSFSMPDSRRLMLRRFSTMAFSRSVAVRVSRQQHLPGPGVVSRRGIHERGDRALDGGERRAQLVGHGVEEDPAQPLRFPRHEVLPVLLGQQLPLHGEGEGAAEHLQGVLLVQQPSLAFLQADAHDADRRVRREQGDVVETAPCAGYRCTCRRGCGCRSTSAPPRTPFRRSPPSPGSVALFQDRRFPLSGIPPARPLCSGRRTAVQSARCPTGCAAWRAPGRSPAAASSAARARKASPGSCAGGS